MATPNKIDKVEAEENRLIELQDRHIDSLKQVVDKQRKQIHQLRRVNEKLREAMLEQSRELGHENGSC